VKIQAKKIANQSERKDYIRNDGWLHHSKDRHNIVYAEVSTQAVQQTRKQEVNG
jgi:hypothetical protein